jgi:hypothetical protein
MKKLILLVTLVAALFTKPVLANHRESKAVTLEVLKAFQKDFILVSNVSWEKINDVFIVRFKQLDEQLAAYYSTDGELQGFGVIAENKALPRVLQNRLQRKFKDASVTEVMKYYSVTDGISHFVQFKSGNRQYLARFDQQGRMLLLSRSKI